MSITYIGIGETLIEFVSMEAVAEAFPDAQVGHDFITEDGVVIATVKANVYGTFTVTLKE